MASVSIFQGKILAGSRVAVALRVVFGFTCVLFVLEHGVTGEGKSSSPPRWEKSSPLRRPQERVLSACGCAGAAPALRRLYRTRLRVLPGCCPGCCPAALGCRRKRRSRAKTNPIRVP